jgi:hypothetical protein
MNSARALLSIKQLEIDYPSRDGQGRVTAVKDLNLELAKITEPELGLSNPPKRCSKVLLPDPEDPTIAIFSEGATSKSIALRTSTAVGP